jgi:CBS domain-containing protein
MKIGELCKRDVVTVQKDDTLIEAARQMRAAHVGDVVVVDRGQPPAPIGILTDRDIVVGVVARDVEHLAMLEVGDVLTARLVTAQEDEEVHDVLSRMRTHGIRRMPVVNEGGALVGILTFDDLIELMAREMTELMDLLARERRQEKEQRF